MDNITISYTSTPCRNLMHIIPQMRCSSPIRKIAMDLTHVPGSFLKVRTVANAQRQEVVPFV